MTGPVDEAPPLASRPIWVHHEEVMGTVFTFDVVHDGGVDVPPPGLLRLLGKVRAVLRSIDAVFSLWKSGSPMSHVRRGELALAEAPAQIGDVLELCERARVLTNGWFDAGAAPGGVDPTGIVKGWAAERALDVLRDGGFHDVLINAAGDLVASGSPLGPGAPGQTVPPWRIGIRRPDDQVRLAAVTEIGGSLPARSVATSGTYERGAHLFDPHTGRHAARLASATVSGPELWLADAAATALAVAGLEGFAFIDMLDGYEALSVDNEGNVRSSAGFILAASS